MRCQGQGTVTEDSLYQRSGEASQALAFVTRFHPLRGMLTLSFPDRSLSVRYPMLHPLQRS